MFIVQLLIFQAFLFLALAVILKRLMGKHATTATAHLQELSQDYLKKQEELKKRLEESERHYQELLAKAQQEGQDLKNQLIREAEEKRMRLLEEARQQAEQVVQQAVQVRDALQSEFQSTLEARAVDRACELIQKVLPRELQESAHSRWVDKVVQNGMIQIERLKNTRERVEEVQVASALPLTATQKERLQDKLQSCFGYPVTLKETVDPRLIAGITITVGHVVLDGSLMSKLKEAARHAQNADDE